MEQEIAENNFLEYGDHNGNLYGTHLDSIRSVIKEGVLCSLKKIFRIFMEILNFRKNVHIGLCAISSQTSPQQPRIHAVCHFYRSTWNGTAEAALC
jgi:hypothetical protein